MDGDRLHFVGDELVAGYGDARALGWVGRVMARTPRTILWTTLAIPGETTAQLAERWQAEVVPRSTHAGTNRLVLGIGMGDVMAGVSPARSRLAVANIVDKAMGERRSCLVVGPPPLPMADLEATASLSRAVEDVCYRRGIPFVETFAPLRNHDQWSTDVAASGGRYPGQAGYGLLAWLVLHRGWYEWLGVHQFR